MASYNYDDFGDDEDFGLGDGVGALDTGPASRLTHAQCLSIPKPASQDSINKKVSRTDRNETTVMLVKRVNVRTRLEVGFRTRAPAPIPSKRHRR